MIARVVTYLRSKYSKLKNPASVGLNDIMQGRVTRGLSAKDQKDPRHKVKELLVRLNFVSRSGGGLATEEHPAAVRIPLAVGMAIVGAEPTTVIKVFDVEHVEVVARIGDRLHCD